jgi:SAM-dependent methyltransferase
MGVLRGWRDVRTLWGEVRKRGPVGALRAGRDALRLRLQIATDRRFDQRFGVDTGGLINLVDVSVDSADLEHCVYYIGTPVTLIRRILRRLPADLREFTFVDFGSGKGRTLLVAARFPFKRIVGVEFGRELHDIAVRNIRACADPRQRCRDIQSVCADARRFEIPAGPCVLYLYRPFSGPVLAEVMERIASSWRSAPRRMYLVYVCPFSSDPFEALGFARRLPFAVPFWSRLLTERFGVALYEARET